MAPGLEDEGDFAPHDRHNTVTVGALGGGHLGRLLKPFLRLIEVPPSVQAVPPTAQDPDGGPGVFRFFGGFGEGGFRRRQPSIARLGLAGPMEHGRHPPHQERRGRLALPLMQGQGPLPQGGRGAVVVRLQGLDGLVGTGGHHGQVVRRQPQPGEQQSGPKGSPITVLGAAPGREQGGHRDLSQGGGFLRRQGGEVRARQGRHPQGAGVGRLRVLGRGQKAQILQGLRRAPHLIRQGVHDRRRHRQVEQQPGPQQGLPVLAGLRQQGVHGELFQIGPHRLRSRGVGRFQVAFHGLERRLRLGHRHRQRQMAAQQIL